MKLRARKNINSVLATTVALGLLASCGSTEAQDSTSNTSDTQSEDSAEGNSLEGVEITFLNSKGEIQAGLEEMAEQFEAETGIKVDILVCGAGESPYTKVTSAYNSGAAPTMSMLDPTDIVALAGEYALDLSDEKWVSETESQNVEIDGAMYSFPFCVEGRGLIYNKAAIENTLGKDFDPNSINSYDSLKTVLEELRASGMENPVVVSKEDWSLGAHQLGYIYDTYDGTTEGSAELITKLENGELNPSDYERYNEFLDTMDLLLEYNVNKADPLGALYEQDPIFLVDEDAAFWANGSWAWANIEEAGAEKDDEYGFVPFVLGNDTEDFANNGIQAAASKHIMIDRVQTTEEEQEAAKEFLNWIVFSESGQEMLVDNCSIVPAAVNNAVEPNDPLGRDIKSRMAEGLTYSSNFIAPSDHWSVMGAAMQKYIAGKSSRDELSESLATYWTSQK